MALTPQMIQAMNKATGNSVPISGAPASTTPSRADQVRALGKSSGTVAPPVAPEEPAIPSIVSKAGSALTQTAENSGNDLIGAVEKGANVIGDSTANQMPKEFLPALTSEITKGGHLAQAGLDAGQAGLGVLFSPVTAAIKALSTSASNSPEVQEFARNAAPYLDAINKGTASYSDLATKHPVLATGLKDIFNMLTLGGGEEGLEKGASVAAKTGDVVKNASDRIKSGIGDLANDKPAVGAPVAPKTSLADGEGILAKGARRIQNASQEAERIKTLPQPVQNAVHTDIPEAWASFTHGLTEEEKKAGAQMLDLQEGNLKTMNPEKRPEQVVGQRILDAVKSIAGSNKSAAEGEGEAVNKGLAGYPVDYGNTADQFKNDLSVLNVKVGDDGRLDFSTSEFKGPSTAKDRGLLQSVWTELRPDETTGTHVKDAKEVHTGRQALFNEMQSRPKDDPFAAKTTAIAENARKGLLADIHSQTPGGAEYRTHATTYAKTQKALTDFYSLLGKKWAGKPEDLLSLRAGEVFNRLKGNASAGAQEVLDRIETLAKENGYKSNIDPRNLVELGNIIKNVVGDTQTGGLAGSVERGTKAALSDAAGAIEHGVSGNVVGAAKAAYKFAKGNTAKEQARALRGLLESRGEK